MASLIHLQDGAVSLELWEEELPEVRRLIEANWGRPGVVRHANCATLAFAGEDFTFQNEWNDPCLISRTQDGANVLKSLCDHLNRS